MSSDSPSSKCAPLASGSGSGTVASNSNSNVPPVVHRLVPVPLVGWRRFVFFHRDPGFLHFWQGFTDWVLRPLSQVRVVM